MQRWLAIGAVNGFLAVALGAFGAHGLKERVDAYRLGVFETGAHYHLVHALAVVAVALVLDRLPDTSRPLARAAGVCFSVGILLFAGSLYALALTGIRALGAITPLGGVGFLLGWALLTAAALRK
jgi:Uncharacterized small membrane protein